MREIFDKFNEMGITPNTYYVLHCIKEDISPDSYVNKELECVKLKNDNWLTEDYKLTAKSSIFIDEINNFFKTTSQKTLPNPVEQVYISKLEEYLDIFPNINLPSGKYARVAVKNLETAFKWFFQNYKYDWITIIQATEKYVDEYSIRNYKYMMTSQYFIKKQKIDRTIESELANYCEIIKTNPNDEGTSYFKERVV